MPATLYDKVLFFPTLGYILARTTLAALTGPFRGASGAPTYGEHVANALVRNFLTYFSIEQIQWVVPSFVDSYKSWCTKNNVKPDIADIPGTTTQGFWLGSKSAKYVLVYYHGGGYMAPGTPQHVDLMVRMLKWSNNNLAIFCVAYTLAPGGAYPSQIAESVEGLRYVLGLSGRSPATTLIGGDSAGGALAFAVLSHISHPHPRSDAVKKLELNSNLKAAITIAPWVSSDNLKYPSMDRFASRDTVNTRNAQYWSEAYKGRGKNVPDDEYVYAALAPANWWKGVKCDYALVMAGGEEGLVDAVTDFVEKYAQGAGKDKIDFVVGERETHDAPLNAIPEHQLKELGRRKQEGAIRLWLMGNIAQS